MAHGVIAILLFALLLAWSVARAEQGSLDEAAAKSAETLAAATATNAGAGNTEASNVDASNDKDSAAVAPASSDSPRFDIMEFRVLGNTVLPQEKIEAAVYPFLGEQRTIDDAEQARTALEKAFHDAGYLAVLVNLPEQKVDGGLVRLEVQESSVEKVRVTGARYFSLGYIKAGVPELASGKTPHFPTMQKQIANLNRGADRKVNPVMRAGKTPGTVEFDLKVQDKLPFHGTIGLNDRYSPDTSRWRTVLNLQYNNLWQQQHSLGLTWVTAPQDTGDVKVFAGSYMVPLSWGDYLALYAIKSQSDVAAVNTLNVLGSGAIFGLRYIKPLPAVDDFYHNLTLGVDYKRFGQTLNLLGGDSLNTPISYLPFSLGWEGSSNSKYQANRVALNLNWHMRDLVGEEAEFDRKRFKASSGYAYLRATVEETIKFENGASLNLRLNGQTTDQPLISNEQFAVSGVDGVRGYLEAEVLGDKGFVSNLEIHSPSIGRRVNSHLEDLHGLAFVDFGESYTLEPLPSQRESYRLMSVGLGARFKFYRFNGVLDYARALYDGATNRTKDGDNRLHVNLEYVF